MKKIYFIFKRVVSTGSKQSFDCVTPSAIVYLDCHYVIYLITGNSYHHFVGMIDHKLNERFN